VADYAGVFRAIFRGVKAIPFHINDMLALPDGRLAIKALENIHLLDPQTGKVTHVLPTDGGCWAMFGNELATSSNDLTLRTWNIHTGLQTSARLLSRLPISPNARYDFCVQTGTDNVCLYGNGEIVKVVDMLLGLYLFPIQLLRVVAMTFLVDGRLIICNNHVLHVYNDHALLVCTRRNPTKDQVCKLMANERWFVSSTVDEVHVWAVATLTCSFSIRNVMHPTLLLDGKMPAVHSKRRNHILIYDLDTNGTLLKTVARSSNVTGLVALPDSSLASSHEDTALCIWR
jgi:WD40 repeat protein